MTDQHLLAAGVTPPAPVDREKLIAEVLDAAALRITADDDVSVMDDEQAEARALGFNQAQDIIEPYVKQLAALAVSPAPLVVDEARPRRRLRACVEAWPDCETGDYNPSCCRFPKSCSADICDPDRVSAEDLEPATEEERGGGR